MSRNTLVIVTVVVTLIVAGVLVAVIWLLLSRVPGEQIEKSQETSTGMMDTVNEMGAEEEMVQEPDYELHVRDVETGVDVHSQEWKAASDRPFPVDVNVYLYNTETKSETLLRRVDDFTPFDGKNISYGGETIVAEVDSGQREQGIVEGGLPLYEVKAFSLNPSVDPVTLLSASTSRYNASVSRDGRQVALASNFGEDRSLRVFSTTGGQELYSEEFLPLFGLGADVGEVIADYEMDLLGWSADGALWVADAASQVAIRYQSVVRIDVSTGQTALYPLPSDGVSHTSYLVFDPDEATALLVRVGANTVQLVVLDILTGEEAVLDSAPRPDNPFDEQPFTEPMLENGAVLYTDPDTGAQVRVVLDDIDLE